MVDASVKPCIRSALRSHEIGAGSPYRLCFAEKGKSGASFGFMQGDLAAGQPEVTAAFRSALKQSGVGDDVIVSLLERLSVHCAKNPLGYEETMRVNDALEGAKAVIDGMDDSILGEVYEDLDRCVDAAGQDGRTIEPEALVYMALWINMSGPPTELLTWLKGGRPRLPFPVPPVRREVTGPDMEVYLQSTGYYSQHPRNFEHIRQCVARAMSSPELASARGHG